MTIKTLRMIPILFILSCGFGGSDSDDNASNPLLLGAHYYHWFPGNFNLGYLRAKLSPPQEPLLGTYDSNDQRVIENHINWAADYGIDFFTLDWWPSDSNSDLKIRRFLSASNISRIRYCIFYEMWALNFQAKYGATVFGEKERKRFVEELRSIALKYFNHPQYLHFEGRPVIILYLTRTAVGEFPQAMSETRTMFNAIGFNPYIIGDEIFWRNSVDGVEHPELVLEPQPQRAKLFEAITSYNLYESEKPQHGGYGIDTPIIADILGLYRSYREATKDSVPILPVVIPGYNDRGVRPTINHYVIPRRWSPTSAEGSFFEEQLRKTALPTLDDRAPFLFVTSWNEWNEDTAIEPTAPSVGTSLDRSLAGDFYTQGYYYESFGFKYLEILRDFRSEVMPIE